MSKLSCSQADELDAETPLAKETRGHENFDWETTDRPSAGGNGGYARPGALAQGDAISVQSLADILEGRGERARSMFSSLPQRVFELM